MRTFYNQWAWYWKDCNVARYPPEFSKSLVKLVVLYSSLELVSLYWFHHGYCQVVGYIGCLYKLLVYWCVLFSYIVSSFDYELWALFAHRYLQPTRYVHVHDKWVWCKHQLTWLAKPRFTQPIQEQNIVDSNSLDYLKHQSHEIDMAGMLFLNVIPVPVASHFLDSTKVCYCKNSWVS